MMANDSPSSLEPFATLGSPTEGSQCWKAWIHSFRYYVEGKGISDPNRCCSLMSHYLGAEIQDCFGDLGDPLEDEAPEDDDAFKKVVCMLSAHFSAKDNPVYEKKRYQTNVFRTR